MLQVYILHYFVLTSHCQLQSSNFLLVIPAFPDKLEILNTITGEVNHKQKCKTLHNKSRLYAFCLLLFFFCPILAGSIMYLFSSSPSSLSSFTSLRGEVLIIHETVFQLCENDDHPDDDTNDVDEDGTEGKPTCSLAQTAGLLHVIVVCSTRGRH